MIHIMVDIEGMNKLPQAHQTRIMQIAATPFNEMGPLHHLGSFNEFADRSFPKHTQDNIETQTWWHNQPIWSEMQHRQDINGLSPLHLIQTFNHYIEQLRMKSDDGHVTLWAAHPEYDITAIYAYMTSYDIEPAWPFYCVKDYATVRDRHRGGLRSAPVTHWADEDVLRQIDVLCQCCEMGWSL